MSNGDKARINLATLKAALAAGALNVRQLADSMGRTSPWGLEGDIRNLVTTQETLLGMGVNVDFAITIFPARERARYGFPDIVPEIKGLDPKRKKREFMTLKGPDGKPVLKDGKPVMVRRPEETEAQTQYWPIVAWGIIEPDETAGGNDPAVYKEAVDFVSSLLDSDNFGEWLTANGFKADYTVKGSRGGISIRLTPVVEETADTATATDMAAAS